MGESRNAYRVLVGRPEGKRPLGRPRRRWEDNIKMDLREVGYDGRDWINLAQDRDQWRACVRAAMNLRKRAKTAQLLQRGEQKQVGKSGCDAGKRTVPVRKYDSILKALSSLENSNIFLERTILKVISASPDVPEFYPAGVLLHASKSNDMSLSHLSTLKCHRPGPGSNPHRRPALYQLANQVDDNNKDDDYDDDDDDDDDSRQCGGDSSSESSGGNSSSESSVGNSSSDSSGGNSSTDSSGSNSSSDISDGNSSSDSSGGNSSSDSSGGNSSSDSSGGNSSSDSSGDNSSSDSSGSNNSSDISDGNSNSDSSGGNSSSDSSVGSISGGNSSRIVVTVIVVVISDGNSSSDSSGGNSSSDISDVVV
ncbi:hypothetical protein ANN_01583 [Periplaneta americana]|uniref:Uncharacterized protein n=1 Tax=Periplaneta americana TaxID=6978 RepID=A0ABQ8TTY9_PERAM|nr:hypothetical protein ANN_01583 [Periplaneta americana]